MEHIIQIAINVEDDRIVKTIEANAERKVKAAKAILEGAGSNG